MLGRRSKDQAPAPAAPEKQLTGDQKLAQHVKEFSDSLKGVDCVWTSGSSSDLMNADAIILLGWRRPDAKHVLDVAWNLYCIQDGKQIPLHEIISLTPVQREDFSCEKIKVEVCETNSYATTGAIFTLAGSLIDAAQKWLTETYETDREPAEAARQKWVNAALCQAISETEAEIREGEHVLFFRRGNLDPRNTSMSAPQVGWLFEKRSGDLVCVEPNLFENRGLSADRILPDFDTSSGDWSCRGWGAESRNEIMEKYGINKLHFVCSWFEKDYDRPVGAAAVATTKPKLLKTR